MARFDLIAVYIMANFRNGAIYTGSTSDLPARIEQHKSGQGSVFTRKYHCNILVYAERCETMEAALHRERRIKAISRRRKLELIEQTNPDWNDLSQTWL